MTALKEGVVYTYSLPQNAANYQIRLTNCAKGLWMCIEESSSVWKLTITTEMIQQTVAKASAGKNTMGYKEFCAHLVSGISKQSDGWAVGIMTPIELEMLRGGNASKQMNNTKLYLILSDKINKFHYPFSFTMNELGEKEKLLEAVKSMKNQLEQLRAERSDKSQLSMLNDTVTNAGEQLRLENQELKKKIRMYEESLVQKRGAVQIDMILKEKNTLEIRAETKRRQENKEIARVKGAYGLVERETSELRSQVEAISKELMMLEDNVSNSNKLKSHAMRVLKSYETELRTLKKVYQKQFKEIETLKRNINTTKLSERKVHSKIKQIQAEIDQARKKTNIKQISNRLHSLGKHSADSSSKAPSLASSNGKASSTKGNIVRQNLLKKASNSPSFVRKDQLLKTSPNINVNATAHIPRNSNQFARPPVTAHTAHALPKKTYSSAAHSDNSSVKSVDAPKPTPEERDRQKRAMERLAGRVKDLSVGRETSKDVKRGQSQRMIAKDLRKDKTAKDILIKMKEVKEHYSKQASKNVATNKNIAAKVAQLKEER